MRPPMRHLAIAVASLSALSLTPAVSSSITVDGRLDASYTQVSVQTNPSNRLDDTRGLATFSNGSELDAAYAAIDGGVLYLFFAGNLLDTIDGFNPRTDADILEVFIDSQPGGQNTLLGPSPTPVPYTGLTFDPGFVPDYSLEFIAAGALDNAFVRYATFGTLPTGSPGTGGYLGIGTNAGAPATFTGGSNPLGIQATIDNSNTAGVTFGCGAATPGQVDTGVEFAIPLAAIGNPTGCISVCAFVNALSSFGVSNQVLGPLPAGTCSLPQTYSAVNFGSFAGSHSFMVCLGATPVRGSSWGHLKSVYR